MSRLLASLTLLMLVGTAAADIPPPKGFKRIPYEAKIAIEKEFAGYVFFTVGTGQAAAVKLDVKTPATISGGRFRGVELIAIPADTAKKYGSEEELEKAVAAGKVDGVIHSKKFFPAFQQVKDSDTRKTAVEEFKLTKVDEKGIVLEAVKATKDAPKNAPEEETEEFSTAPKNGAVVSGIAAFLGLALAGLWMVRRWR